MKLQARTKDADNWMYQPRINLTIFRYGGPQADYDKHVGRGLGAFRFARRNVLVTFGACRLCQTLLTAHGDARSVRLHGRARSDLRQQLQGQGVRRRGFTCPMGESVSAQAWLTMKNTIEEPFRPRRHFRLQGPDRIESVQWLRALLKLPSRWISGFLERSSLVRCNVLGWKIFLPCRCPS